MDADAPTLIPIQTTHRGGGEIETATVEAFENLESQGLLGAIEKAKRAALIRAAAALDAGFASGKLSVAVSNTMKQYMEGMESLPRPISGTDSTLDAYEETVRALTKKALAS